MAVVALSAASGAKAELSAEERMQQLEERIDQLENQLAGDSAEAAENMKNDATGRSDDWMEGLKIFGQLRLRYKVLCYNDQSEKKARRYGQIRVRIGIKKIWLDEQLAVVFRLSTGDGDPTCSNSSMTGNFQDKEIWIDQAYAKYTPKSVKGLTLIAGKMPKPWVHTPMLWDGALNPEGLWGEYRVSDLGPVEPFVGMGLFALNHNATDHDATMHAYTIGARWKVTDSVKWTSAVTYYDYAHFANNDNWSAGSGPGAGGNSSSGTELLATDFNILNLTNKVEWTSCGMPMNFLLDFAHNCGNDYGGQSDAISFGGGVGKNKTQGDWSVNYVYRYIQADSVPGQFNEATFGRSNRRGHSVCGRYNITDSLVAAATLYYTQPITGSSSDTTTAVLLDLIWSF